MLLAALSLPLLVVSLILLNNFRTDLDKYAAETVRMETAAAAGSLLSWLEDHQAFITDSRRVSQSETQALYVRLRRVTDSDPANRVIVTDAAGQTLVDPSSIGPAPPSLAPSNSVARLQWSDNIARMTGIKRIEPFGWSVVVGAPLAATSIPGRSTFWLAATWVLVLVASILLGFWAAGRFTKPLRKLASTAATLGEGNLAERAVIETDDEVGALARHVNLMAAHLQTKFAELRSQGDFIEEILDGLPLGLAVLDERLIVRKANTTFALLTGRDAAQLSGRGLYEAAAGLAVLSDIVEDVRRTRKPFVTYGLPLSLGVRNDETGGAEATTFWDITIWPTSERSAGRGDLILILSEVSKRVRAEKLATSAFASERTRAAELQSVINQMNEGVVIISQDRTYRVNPAAAMIIGRRPGEFRDGTAALIQDISFTRTNGQELPSAEHPIYRALELREQLSGERLEITHANGEKRVVAISATPLTGENGSPEGAVAVFRDITDEVGQHDALVAAYERLREHDRLKSAFVSNISHELRTPLNVIIGLCQLLERDRHLPLAPLQNEAVTRMQRNARMLLDLVNDLLDYSRLEAGRSALHLTEVDVRRAIEDVTAENHAVTEAKEIQLKVDVAADLGSVLTDKHKLQQVLSNLVGNAIKFTTAGTVTIKAAPIDRDRWCLEVSDTGIGISGDALTYIFDEFRQVDDRLARSYGGTGLGLAITRKIVELLEGEISVESQPQEGSRFRIVWPRRSRQHTGTGSLVRAFEGAQGQPLHFQPVKKQLGRR